jgi:hypothetical protein
LYSSNERNVRHAADAVLRLFDGDSIIPLSSRRARRSRPTPTPVRTDRSVRSWADPSPARRSGNPLGQPEGKRVGADGSPDWHFRPGPGRRASGQGPIRTYSLSGSGSTSRPSSYRTNER